MQLQALIGRIALARQNEPVQALRALCLWYRFLRSHFGLRTALCEAAEEGSRTLVQRTPFPSLISNSRDHPETLLFILVST